MTTEHTRLEVAGLKVEVRRKPIKNLHLGVYPPDGRVRVAAPPRLDDDAIRRAVISRLPWIRRQQRGFRDQVRESEREMLTGESHYFQGRRYRLDVVERPGRSRIMVTSARTLSMSVPPHSDTATRQRLLERWYRQQLTAVLPDMVSIWEPILGVRVGDCRIKRMKTRWGSCNIAAGRIWLNLDLIRKPPACLEYILVHEMVHLLERHHTDRFRALMDQFLPAWRLRRDMLNSAPLAHEAWRY